MHIFSPSSIFVQLSSGYHYDSDTNSHSLLKIVIDKEDNKKKKRKVDCLFSFTTEAQNFYLFIFYHIFDILLRAYTDFCDATIYMAMTMNFILRSINLRDQKKRINK